MCVIMNINNGIFPNLETLKDAELLNSHGGSIAWLENEKISFKKGINAIEIHDIITKLKTKNVKTAIIHFRIASVGEINKQLCHPFIISEKSELILEAENIENNIIFHNGTINNWKDMLIDALQKNDIKMLKGDLSDSRVIAFLINVHGFKILKQVNKGNKFSILTKHGIIKFGDWVKVDNIECSNDYFVKNFIKDYFDLDNEIKLYNKALKNGMSKTDIEYYLNMNYDLDEIVDISKNEWWLNEYY